MRREQNSLHSFGPKKNVCHLEFPTLGLIFNLGEVMYGI